jgi:DNA (cytosine-5)-methyltransferase 1
LSLTVTDLFAGAGGSSTGAVSVPGISIRIASNHWQRAVEVHNANHPEAEHVCADISQVNPRRFPTTDTLWASPECTNHSRAKGKLFDGQPDLFGEVLPDDAAERSRATMWDVVRFSEVHRYKAVIVENVVEAARWLPFRAWLLAMESLGYEHHIVYLNSMHAHAAGPPAPQSRDRMYVVFWRKGDTRPDFEKWQTPRAWCPACERVVEARQVWKRQWWGRYRQQYVYTCPTCKAIVEPGWLPAATAIDWSLPGTRIGDRGRPLAEKTRARIAAGIARYWRPLTVEAAGNTYDAANPRHPQHGDPNGYYRAWPVEEAFRTLHTSESKGLAYPPFIVERRFAYRTRGVDEPLSTLTANDTSKALISPFIAELRGGGSDARSVGEALATIVASGNHHALVQPPFLMDITRSYDGHRANRSWTVDEAMPTQTTQQQYALVAPYYGTSRDAKPASDPLGTLTTRDRYALIMRNNTARGDQGQMSTPVHEALRTITTAGHQSLITPGDLEAAAAQVDDCLFRMLEPHEVAAGMAFPGDYKWDGTRRERVRMAGNAVTPPAARDLIACVTEALTGEPA